jgi:alpha-1,4-digalacturonate transport system substrate-binding protein
MESCGILYGNVHCRNRVDIRYLLRSSELAATGSQPGAEWGYQAFTGVVQTDVKDKLVEVLAGQLSVEQYLTDMDALFTEKLKELQ